MKWIKAPRLVPGGYRGWVPIPGVVLSVFSEEEAPDGHYWHEWTHAVKQGQRYGPFYGIVWLYHVLRIWFDGGDPYMEHPFEEEARYWAKIATVERWKRP